MRNKFRRWLGAILGLTIFLFLVTLVALSTGPVKIPFKKIIFVFFKEPLSFEREILLEIRLPRVILGFSVGCALSIAGVILQGLFRNPLVEPYTLGIAGGAALGVCLSSVSGIGKIASGLTLPLSGFLGALSIILGIYLLAHTKYGSFRLSKLLLIGVMISFITSSLITLIMAFSRVEELHGIIFWIMGSLQEPNWNLIKIVLSMSLVGLGVACLFSRQLNAFALGEEEALHLGINTERVKKILFLLASLLTGSAVSVAGIIGFVGLIIPHSLRLVVGSDHRVLIVASGLAGASFLILCDTLARVIIAPLELPLGVLTGIIGGSVFIYLLSREQRWVNA
jgi:iron complex transport system permease protein